MSDDSRFTGNGKNEKKTEIKVPSRNWLLWILILGSIPLLMFFHERKEAKYQQISRQQLIQLITNNVVRDGVIHYSPQSSVLNEITGWYAKTDSKGAIIKDATGNEIPVHFKR